MIVYNEINDTFINSQTNNTTQNKQHQINTRHTESAHIMRMESKTNGTAHIESSISQSKLNRFPLESLKA